MENIDNSKCITHPTNIQNSTHIEKIPQNSKLQFQPETYYKYDSRVLS